MPKIDLKINLKTTTCNGSDLETLGPRLVNYAQKSPRTLRQWCHREGP
jgi:hypothetical protein